MGRVFHRYEVPVAYSLFALTRGIPHEGYQPFHKYIFLWMAFNNIYTTNAEYRGYVPKLRTRRGRIITKREGGVNIPEVSGPTEIEQIKLACAELSEELKHSLIMHPNIEFFLHRTPSWHMERLEYDKQRQKLNGVLNVGRTINKDHPVWSPIDISLYTRYKGNNQDVKAKNTLAIEIVNLLYTVRNNLLHGGKRADDANDHQVVEKATPLLKMIVSDFLADKIYNSGPTCMRQSSFKI